ncbi:MAG: hypothetical protein K2X09_07460 [Rickettsiales bacterium]|nr:hypothetical protein [Rickettsiales bacterium]
MRTLLFSTILSLTLAMPVMAQQVTTPSSADIAATVQKLSGKKNSPEALGQVLVIGSLMGCTQKTVGKPATQAFYNEMQVTGKQVEIYCKQGNKAEARALLLATFAAKKDDRVVKAALSCYDAQTQTVAALGGARLAADAAHYARWLRDPEIAKTELKESDVCRGPKKQP